MCTKCKEIRDAHQIYDPPMGLALLTATHQYWNLHLQEKQVEELVAKNEALENENNIVNWYIAVMEQGHDTREVIELYEKLKKDHLSLQQKT